MVAAPADSNIVGAMMRSDPGHPIAVFSGNTRVDLAMFGEQDTGPYAILEQNLPIQLWGTEYVGLNAPALLDDLQGSWQIVASQPNTVVDVEYSGTIDFLGMPGTPFMMNDGDVVSFTSTNGGDNGGDFVIVANKPVGVMNYVRGRHHEMEDDISVGAAMISVAPSDRLRNNYIIFWPEGERGWLGVGRPIQMPVSFNGQNIVPQSVTALWMASDWEAATWEFDPGVTRISADEDFAAKVVLTLDGYVSWSSEWGIGYLPGLRTD
ncbi:hypothetical protein ENSA7_38490 [Enhygromyxa salina]|uniref:IgGFc-binding protein N-terminal domain-containing protein n=2 Tax=Enhygromyxa salina TaxID=215803 RepID=A0A2S9YNA2_9BACT|nr:hypothetical protein ENSA7_38490 [Enhygromyxa salina]